MQISTATLRWAVVPREGYHPQGTEEENLLCDAEMNEKIANFSLSNELMGSMLNTYCGSRSTPVCCPRRPPGRKARRSRSGCVVPESCFVFRGHREPCLCGTGLLGAAVASH